MKKQLDQIRISYDEAIDYGSKGIDLYKNLPETITNHRDYPAYQKCETDSSFADSRRKEIIDFLEPKIGMTFVDLGCCLNLMFRGYDEWPSTYYGVDISSKTIQLLKHFTTTKQLAVGALHCGSVHETSFETDQFDIGACIGVLEYFGQEYIEKALREFHRIMKPNGKLVIDVPDLGSPEQRISQMIEAHMGRPTSYELSPDAFEALLTDTFSVVKKEKVGPMIQYFLLCRK